MMVLGGKPQPSIKSTQRVFEKVAVKVLGRYQRIISKLDYQNPERRCDLANPRLRISYDR